MSLDPDDFEALRKLGHAMVDRLIDRHRELAKSKVYRQFAAKNEMRRELPRDGIGFFAAYDEFLRLVEPYATGNMHPRFFGWAMGSGTTFGALAQMLADDVNAFGGAQAATYVEAELLDWLKEILRQPKEASGLLTSGASISNLYALYVAREKIGKRRVFTTEEVHVSVDRACRMLGLELVKSLDAIDDSALAIVGTAGTVLTGAFEDLERMAELARAHAAWFHVDAAIGIGAALTPKLQDNLRGLERADSVAFDLHKWLQISSGTGGLLVRDAKAHEAAFRQPTPYLGAIRGGLGGSDRWFHRLGLEHTRRFLALEPWMVLVAYGVDRLRDVVEHGIELAHRFAELVDASPELERLSDVPLNIVLFRFRASDRVNERLIAELQQRGIAVFSPARTKDTFALRAAFFGHRTTERDLVETIAKTIEIGKSISGNAGSR